MVLAIQSTPTQAETLKLYQRNIVSVYDGDTFHITPPKSKCSMHILCAHVAVRLKGIDTPEIRGQCELEKQKAVEAKIYLANRLRSGHKIQLKNLKRDKHYRIDADLYIEGKNIAQEMIGKGLGVSYDGKRRSGWCSL